MDGRHDNDLELLLSAYRDGELAPEERAVVEEALRDDPTLQARLSDHEALSTFLRASLEEEADRVDFSGFADSVLAALPGEAAEPAAEPAAVPVRTPAPSPSLWSRFASWLDDLLGHHRWQAASGLAVVVALLVAGPLIWSSLRSPSSESQGPLLAGGSGMASVIDVQTPEETDAMLFRTASGTTVIYVQGN